MSDSDARGGTMTRLVAAACIVAASMGGRALMHELWPPERRMAQRILRDAQVNRLEEVANAPVPEMSPRLAAMYKDMSRTLADDPLYVRYMQNEVQRVINGAPGAGHPQRETLAYTDRGAVGLGAELSAKGTARLSPAQLSESIALKLKLARKSPKLCAGFWSGGITLQDLANVMDAEFSDADARRWFELSLTSTRLELNAKEPPPRIRGVDVVEGMRLIFDALTPVEAEALQRTLDTGASAAPEAACKAFIHLMDGGLRLPQSRQDAFLRGMAFADLVDWEQEPSLPSSERNN